MRSAPCRALISSISSRAAAVALTPPPFCSSPAIASEETHRFRVVGYEEVLGLPVVGEHHFVVLPPDAGLLVPTEGRMGRIMVVAIRPDAARLDLSAHAEGAVTVPGPDACAQTVERVVGDRQRLSLVLEGRYRDDGTENLLLEDAHRVFTEENGRFDIEAMAEFTVEFGPLAPGEHFGPLVTAEFE